MLNERIRHLGQERLSAAVAGVEIRTFGESWVFSARQSPVDITPLLASVLATIPIRDTQTDQYQGGFVDLADFLDD